MSLAREVLIGFAVLKDLLAAKWRTGGGAGLEAGAVIKRLWQDEG